MTGTVRFTSIRLKLILLVMSVTFLALVVEGVATAYNDWSRYRDSLRTQLITLADIISRASAPALSFNDAKTASETLAVLGGAPKVHAAALYTAKGELFARYVMPGRDEQALPRFPETDGVRLTADSVIVFQRVVDNNEILGSLYLEMDNDQTERLLSSVAILATVMAAAMLIALLLSTRLQRSVIQPLLSVAGVAQRVVDTRDFSLRAPLTSEDETGALVRAFNAMLDEIEQRAVELESVNRSLEHEIADRRSAQGALQLSERRSLSLVSAIAAVTWVADRHGAWNGDSPAWAEYTGQRAADYQGLGWRNAFHDDDRLIINIAWERALVEEAPFEIDVRLWNRESAGYRFVSLRAVPSKDAEGTLEEWVGSISDIHDRRLAEEEVRMLNAELEQRVKVRTEQLEEANRELESFSYSVSHDLRSPVRAVSGFSKILANEHAQQLDSEGHRLLGVIQSEAARMGALIDDLLAFSRMGRKAMQPAVVDMQTLSNSTLQSLLLQHNGSVPELRVGSLPQAWGDRSLLAQVWSNLLANALKFSGKVDKPAVEIGAISEDDEHIYFVRDNGAGFDPRYKAKLFGVFQRLHDASEFTGTGVGLALVQRIVTRHGGRVWADGAVGKGATFYFTLPRKEENGND